MSAGERKAIREKQLRESKNVAKSTWFAMKKQGKTPPTWKLGKHNMIWVDVADAWWAGISGDSA